MGSLWAVTATVGTISGKWETIRQVPTFYLHSKVQGILSADHAITIAREVIGRGDNANITVVEVDCL